MQRLNPDFRDRLLALSAEGVEFLVVGAYAVAVHGIPRATKDLDIWVGTRADNAARVHRALARYGAPLEGVTPADFASPDLIHQIGVAPQLLDVITSIEGVTFDEAWPRRLAVDLDGVTVPVLSREDLVGNKRAAGRSRDLVDLEEQGE